MPRSKSFKLLHFALWVLAAIALSAGVDLSLSAMNGYALRTDTAILAVLEVLFLSPIVLAVLAGLYAAGRIFRVNNFLQCAPWSSMGLAAWSPIALARLWESHGLGGILIQVGIFSLLDIAAFVEFRRDRAMPRPLPLLSTVCAGLAAMILSIALPLPGRSMVHDPVDEPVTKATPESPNLILICLDTTRADHLTPYGYPRPTSPWLDEFAKKATLFEHLVACSSYTLPTHASLFTGLFPGTHGADVARDPSARSLAQLGLQHDKVPVQPLSPDAVTLAEVAREGGLATGAICANSAYLSRYFQLDQGFNTYVDAKGAVPAWRAAGMRFADRILPKSLWRLKRRITSSERYYLLASEVNQLALRWLQPRRDRRFFLFLNYMDAHVPYLPTGKYRKLFPFSDARQQIDHDAIVSGQRAILDSEREPLVDAYDAGIRSVDDRLSELFARLQAWHLLDKTLVVIVGDHGESIGEHHKLFHPGGIYEPEVHVPLIYCRPGQTEGDRIGRTVGSADIMPTMLADLHLPIPAGVQGGSLFEEKRSYPVVTELGLYERDYASSAVYDSSWKLIQETNGTIELYNLVDDPGEENNLAPKNPDVVKRLQGSLSGFASAAAPRFDEVAESKQAVETLKNLRSLGYLH